MDFWSSCLVSVGLFQCFSGHMIGSVKQFHDLRTAKRGHDLCLPIEGVHPCKFVYGWCTEGRCQRRTRARRIHREVGLWIVRSSFLGILGRTICKIRSMLVVWVLGCCDLRNRSWFFVFWVLRSERLAHILWDFMGIGPDGVFGLIFLGSGGICLFFNATM
jgi:hypothetical protein